MIRFCQPLTKKLEGRQIQRAGREQLVNDRKSPRDSRSQNAAKRFTFAKPKLLDAKLEHRRKPRLKVKAALLDFSEVRDELRRELAVRPDELCNIGEKFTIRSMSELHAFRIAR